MSDAKPVVKSKGTEDILEALNYWIIEEWVTADV